MKSAAVLILFGLLFPIACRKVDSFSGSNAKDSFEPQRLKEKVVREASTLSEKKLITEKINEIQVETRTSLRTVHFLDETHGWIGGTEKVYKTEDGGKSWQEVKFEVPEGAYVKNIVFVSPTMGWITLQKSSPLAIDYQINHFWLKHTNDGGQSWQLQYEGHEAEVTALSFSDAWNGWLSGTKFIGLRPFRFTYLLLHTSDQGHNWAEVAGQLKRLTADRKRVSPDGINAGIMGVSTSDLLSATVITSERELLKTSNGGVDWREIGLIPGEPPQAGIRRSGLKKDGNSWVVGSADSAEGVWGTLMVEQSGTSWTSFQLPGIYFADAVFLSGSQFLACGYIVNDKAAHIGEKQGVILYSPDEGRTWSIIYRSKHVKAINSISAAEPTQAMAVGENGFVLRVRLGGPASSDLSKPE